MTLLENCQHRGKKRAVYWVILLEKKEKKDKVRTKL